MSNHKHIREELIIEFALGIASEEIQVEVKNHMNECEKCESQLNGWMKVVSEPTTVKPSIQLKERIWDSVNRKQQPTKKNRKQGRIFAVCSAAALFLFFIGTLVHYQANVNNGYEVATNDDIKRQVIQSNPKTQQLVVIPVTAYKDITGNLWINNETEELLLEVNGLRDISNRDHQLWMIYENNEIKGELLSPVNGVSSMWIKGRDVNEFKFIKASVEPLGGSIEPTGPETFVVPIKTE